MVLTLLEVFVLGHYDPPSTGRMQQLPTAQTANGTNRVPQSTKLLKPETT